MKKADIDKLVYDAIAAGARNRQAVRKDIGFAAAPGDIAASIQRLRFSGRVRLDRLEINRVEEPEAPGAGVGQVEVAAVEAVAPAIVAAAGIAEQVRAEAQVAGERRRTARSTGTVTRTLASAPVAVMTRAEKLVSLALDDPRDLYAMVKRQWSGLLGQVIAQARELGVSPVQHLVATIEKGLDR